MNEEDHALGYTSHVQLISFLPTHADYLNEPNGLLHTSPGHRPGYRKPSQLQAEGLLHRYVINHN